MYRRILMIFVVVTIAELCLFCKPKEYNISSYGAVGDGIVNNAVQIQSAIDDAYAGGGGKVIIPPGNFATGVIFLKSNVELYLSAGARLLGSPFRKDYDNPVALAIVVAKDAKNISVTGTGVIDGQAPELMKNLFVSLQDGSIIDNTWQFKRPDEKIRPMLIKFIGCSNVTIKDVSLKNSAGWTQDYKECSGLIIDNIKVENTAYWNNDGLDVTDCKNVKITNCFVNSADDGICLKSENRKLCCDSVYIADCTIRSSASAFKLGTASWGGFKNIKVRNLTIYDTYRSAVAIECVDGGKTENIDIENINCRNIGNAIFIKLGQRNVDSTAGVLKNIRIANLKAEVPLRKPDLGYPFEGPPDYLRYRYKNSFKERPLLGYPFIGQPMFPYNLIPSSITGIPGEYVKNITLENIEIIFGGAADKKVAYIPLDSLKKVPEMKDDYPEFSMFGELPAWGIYVRHADGIIFKNVKMSFKEDDFRPAMVFDDARNIKLEAVHIPTVKELPVILLNETKEFSYDKLQIPVSEHEGIKKTEQIK
jgi:pectate lyase